MAWNLDKVPFRLERHGWRVHPVRYEWGCVFSSHGGAWGTAFTQRGAVKRLKIAQYEVLTDIPWKP